MVSGLSLKKAVTPLEDKIQEKLENKAKMAESKRYPIISHTSGYPSSHSRHNGKDGCSHRVHFRSGNMARKGETWRQRHRRPVLKQMSLNWNAPDKYMEVLSFNMEVTNILQTKMYTLTEDENVPIIENWLSREGLQCLHFYKFHARSMQNCKGTVFIMWEIQTTP